jgi:chaperonin cofactor prefoldin
MAKLDDDDLKAIKNLMEVTIDDAIEKKELVTKKDISHLPTKDEFYEQTGKILKRLDDLEEEKDALSHRVSNHEDRINNLESHLQSTTD